MADADFESSHPCVLGLAKPLVKRIQLSLRAYNSADPAPDHECALSCDQIEHLVVYLDHQEFYTVAVFYHILETCLEVVVASQNTDIRESLEGEEVRFGLSEHLANSFTQELFDE